jgi:CubicO group peptidase (beta-lactamase class C family)
MVYSDLGAIILGEMVSRVAGMPLDVFLRVRVFEPLGMRETMFRPPASLQERIAPTEIDPWRQRHLRGEVHDENAFALGGVSAHAGLFSTARDLTRMALMFLGDGTFDGQRFLSTSTIDRFTSPQDSALSHRALGWETPNGTNSAGRLMSRRSFGHTGFTGTSFWVDRDRDVFVILLTNRVNPTRERRQIGAIRVAVADAVLGAIAARKRGQTPFPTPSPCFADEKVSDPFSLTPPRTFRSTTAVKVRPPSPANGKHCARLRRNRQDWVTSVRQVESTGKHGLRS